jgi:hypothetical protein
MKAGKFFEYCLVLMLVMSISGCKSNQTTNIKNGAVVISGDLTYDKLMDALSPFMKNGNTSGISEDEKGYVTQKIAIDRDLKKISISCVVDLVFTQSDDVSAVLKVPDKWVQYYHASYADGVLKIVPDGNSTLNVNKEDDHVKLFVSAPHLSALNLTGVCMAKIGDLTTKSDFNIECSGVGNVVIGSLTGPGMLKIKSGGASNVAIKSLNMSNLDAEIFGASNASIDNMEGEEVKGNIYGASQISLKANCNQVFMKVSGASHGYISGKAKSAEMKADGLSNIDLKNFSCPNIEKNTSGLSKIDD